MVAAEHLSLSQARRLTLRSHGLAAPRPARTGPATMRHLQSVVDRLGLLQIDSVNVLARAHLLPTFSRVGPYDPGLLDRAAGRAPRRLVEAWAHQASFVPPATFRLLGWRQRAYAQEAWGSIAEVPLQLSSEVAEVRALVRAEGPLTGRQVHDRLSVQHPVSKEAWGWNWTVAKRVLEFLFFTGELTAAGRTSSFERRYDLAERVLPAEVVAAPEPTDAEAARGLVEIAARAHGVASVRCLADYFRMRQDRVRPAVAELVEDGVLEPVVVEGWGDGPVLRHRDADVPRRATGAALLSPFDPVVFERRRVEALFGLRYRIEIYVPEPARVWGYYVLPFLLGEHVVALVDLKADRSAGVLRVLAAHPAGTAADPGPARSRRGAAVPDAGEVVEALAAELHLVAAWLGLDEVRVGDRDERPRGALALPLAARLPHAGRPAGATATGSPTMVTAPAAGRDDADDHAVPGS
ncbi:winged helix-turn-helix domain-containing protein [Cellulomonas endophytica]|uniref:winged helix-turn-helix domain-containing protein n=1 Tax=Cellulomonas endophytica TaxID=2494735 RepID=UPI001F0BFD73|nr:crosslink repair DNA glycosylase YcaQ family protein [Cellulomonas endophytica]